MNKNRALYLDVLKHWYEMYQAFKSDNVEWAMFLDIALRNGDHISYGSNTCAYCEVFGNFDKCAGWCAGCPVMINTGLSGCEGSPWEHFFHSPNTKNAFEELEFLRKNPPKGVRRISFKKLEELCNEK